MDSSLLRHHAEKLRKFAIRQEDLDAIKRTCGDCGISDDGYVTLVGFVVELAEFKHIHKPKKRTGSQKKKDLERVQAAAYELQLALSNLELESALLLDVFLKEAGLTGDDSDGHPFDLSSINAAAQAARRVDQATKKAIDNMGKRGLDKPGRVKTLEAQAGIIALIAVSLKVFDIAPGDNGPFRRICDALYGAAGMGCTAQGAIKCFQKNWRPVLQGVRACL